MFIFQNKRRDRAVAEGRVEYDEIVTGLSDLSDWKNPAFRYVTVGFFLFPFWTNRLRRTDSSKLINTSVPTKLHSDLHYLLSVFYFSGVHPY